jgi:hypothetical protein
MKNPVTVIRRLPGCFQITSRRWLPPERDFAKVTVIYLFFPEWLAAFLIGVRFTDPHIFQ